MLDYPLFSDVFIVMYASITRHHIGVGELYCFNDIGFLCWVFFVTLLRNIPFSVSLLSNIFLFALFNK